MTPAREYWTPEALAEACLPDLPTTKRRINALADREGWRAQVGKARRRKGRGGGWEYHWTLLPARAQAALMRKTAPAQDEPQRDRHAVWAEYQELSEAARGKAKARLEAVQRVEALSAAMGRDMAVTEVARLASVSPRTLWRWMGQIEGVDPADWLAYLAPRHRMAAKRVKKQADFGSFFELFKADYLRLEAPSLTSCFERVRLVARQKKWSVPNERTLRRWVDALPRASVVLAREGERGLAKLFPPQIRDKTKLTALEAVNADCHKIDVFVMWGDEPKPMRPQIVAFQDIYSGKILSWKVDRAPNKVAVMSAFGELVETYGIPRDVLFDNGREFANKWLTGGVPTRFRFKVCDTDPLGVLPQLGIKIHWARPGHGQAKPIERAFRDIADHVAKDPRFAGAYVGHKPDAKPENYMSRAIPLEDFMEVVAEGIERHNARVGRRSETAQGRSFDETFAESYARAPIRKATPEQRRLWLMGQEKRRAHATHGRITLHKAAYWSDWMMDIAGQEVIARFDPEDLNAGLEIYGLDGAYLGFAATQEKTPFFNLASAQEHAALERRRIKAEKRALEAQRPLGVDQIAAELAGLSETKADLPETKVVELVQKNRGPLINRALPQPELREGEREAEAALILKFEQSQKAASKPQAVPDDPAARYRRAVEIEHRLEADQPVGSEEAKWLYGYQKTSEYRTHQRLAAKFGTDAIGQRWALPCLAAAAPCPVNTKSTEQSEDRINDRTKQRGRITAQCVAVQPAGRSGAKP